MMDLKATELVLHFEQDYLIEISSHYLFQIKSYGVWKQVTVIIQTAI